MTAIAPTSTDRRAGTLEELQPLRDLCDAGHLFEVQDWIRSGKPVNLPLPTRKGKQPRSPLQIAVRRGFHSLVQVLLEGGAMQEPADHNAPMAIALESRRFDMVRLLMDHGFDPMSIDRDRVLHSWSADSVSLFIERGLDVVSGDALAAALCDRIRTLVNVVKYWIPTRPKFAEQANIALRNFCFENSARWVGLLLWAGADPLARGTCIPGEAPDQSEHGGEGLTAVEWAATNKSYEVLKMKRIRDLFQGEVARDHLGYLCRGEGLKLLERLLASGLDPNDPKTGGSPAFAQCLAEFEGWCWNGYWSLSQRSFHADRREKRQADCTETREIMKAIHLLAIHGAKWKPVDKKEIRIARKPLLGLKPGYTVEFVWIMKKYSGCSKVDVTELLRTPAMKAHLEGQEQVLNGILAGW